MKKEIQRLLTAQTVFSHYNLKLPTLNNRPIRCPLGTHEDKKPSFSIDTKTGFWNCFSCSASGDLLSFVGKMEGMDTGDRDDFPKIMKIAAGLAGVSTESTGEKAMKLKKQWEELPDKKPKSVIESYKEKTGIDMDALSSVVAWKQWNEESFVVPLKNWRGAVVGMQRSIKQLTKGSTHGFFFEKINKRGVVYIVEGLSDYLTMMACGITNTIGIVSANMNTREIVKILDGAVRVNICFDYDKYKKNGQASGSLAGANKAIAVAEKIGTRCDICFASMSEKKDINDLYKDSGASGVMAAFRNSIGITQLRAEIGDLKKIGANHYASGVLDRHNLIIGEKTIWECNENNVWSEISVGRLHSIVKTVLEEYYGIEHDQSLIKEVCFYVKAETEYPHQQLMDALASGSQGEFYEPSVFLREGRYEIFSGKVYDYKSQDYIYGTLPISLAEKNEETPEMFLKFLGEVFDGYDEPEKHIMHIQEWFGYTLFPAIPFHKFLFIVGEGGNGKGVLTDILTSLVGGDNIVNTGLRTFEANEDKTIMLFNKYANLCSEEGSNASVSSPFLKKVTGGGFVTGRRLYREAVSFKPFAKMWFSSNYMPVGGSDASNLSRRMHLLRLKNVFDNGEDRHGEKDLDKKILRTEREMIFWWAIEGLKRLISNKEFTEPKFLKQSFAEFVDSQDIIKAFLENGLEANMRNAGQDTTMNMYEDFRNYAIKKEGRAPQYVPSKPKFMNYMRERGYIVKKVEFGSLIFEPDTTNFEKKPGIIF